MKDVMSKGAGKTRKAYMYQLAAEIITGECVETFSNSAMEWGTETEPMARAVYEFENNIETIEVGFIEVNDYLGCSPDGLVFDDGGLEIKCPKTTTQIETYLSGKMPTMHKAQVQSSIWISEREWWDFVSFDPRINGAASYFCQRIFRDENYINEMAIEVDIFKEELIKMVQTLKG